MSGAFISSSALSAETVAVMAHNKSLEVGADTVLLLKGSRDNAATLLELLLLKIPSSSARYAEW